MSSAEGGVAGSRSRRAAGLISPALAGETNRARVLQALYDNGPQTRATLARLTGVTRATIGTIVQPMINDGVLDEGDPLPSGSGGGKPSRPLWFSRSGTPLGAVYLLPGRVEAALVSAEGKVLDTSSGRFSARTRDTDRVLETVVDCLRAVLPDGGQVLGVGMAVAGMVDSDEGTIVKMNLAPGLGGFTIGPRVAERLGTPTYIDHQPRAQALADRWFGVGRGVASFAAIYTGETLGIGLVLDGHVYRGPGGAGGEIGHTFVQVDGEQCQCGQYGCWETIATLGWLRREAERLDLSGASRMTARRLGRLAASGDPVANQLQETYARNIAVGIANVQQVLAPGLFIVHGDAADGGDDFVERIQAHVRELVPAHPSGRPELVRTDVEPAALLGAAGVVLSHSLRLAV